MNVILNEVKNLLHGNTLTTLSMVGCEEIATSGEALLAMTEYCSMPRNDAHEQRHSERSEESPQWQYTINVVYGRL